MELIEEFFMILCFGLFGHLFTRKAQTWNLSSVRASALAGTLAGLWLQFGNPQGVLMVASFFGGSFVGMTDPQKFKLNGILISTFIFSVAFFFLRKPLNGSGGLLGFSAFISVMICHYFQKLKYTDKAENHPEI